MLLSKVVQFIVDTKLRSNNRRVNPISLAKAKDYYAALKKTVRAGPNKNAMKKILRQDEADVEDVKRGVLVENELKNSLDHKKSALYDRPYVEHQGKNDYLVMREDIFDSFVTVVPNHIYYNAEKKCVNWLDDCSLGGIRARLLRGAMSPYK